MVETTAPQPIAEAALAAGDRTPGQVVTRVYTDIGPDVRPAAELSVQAQLDYLASRGELGQHQGG